MGRRQIYFALLMCLAIPGFAQQLPHYSQYMLNDYVINPAVAGARPYYEARSSHRYQWVGITDAPRTYTLSMNGPNKRNNMGFGGFLYTDNVGPTRRTGFQMSYSYHVRLGENSKLSFGLSAGIHQFVVDAHKINLRDEADNVLGRGVISIVVPDSKFGLFLYGKRYYLGCAAPQLFHNKLKFYGNANSLSRLEDHYFLTGGYRFNLGKDFALLPSFILKYNAPAPMQLDLNIRALVKEKVWFGLSYRSLDAVSLMLGFRHNERLLVGYAYDVSTSNLSNYNSGSHELVLGIRFLSTNSKASKRGTDTHILQ